jgi:hypothetical protein
MKLDQLMSRANVLYPDNMIQRYYTEPKRNHGDTLAKFIVLELQDTFDPDVTDKIQTQTAQRTMVAAARELLNIAEGL